MRTAGLPTPRTRAGRDGLAALLAAPSRSVVALDFDGTLAPIVADPGAARPYPGSVPALARLASCLASVALITGRPARAAAEYGGFAGVPGLEELVVIGRYGAERWEAATGTSREAAPHPGVAAARYELPAVLERTGSTTGVQVEDTGGSLAVHARRAADPSAAFALLRGPMSGLAERHGLILQQGRLVLELRPPGADKGSALREYVRGTGADVVLYAGDDLGDLAAFAAADKLRADGVAAVLVCSASTEVTEVAERADLVVNGPAGIAELLGALADRLVP